MNEEKKIEFTQKWIGDAVKKFLQKEDIYESDMERIRYMRIGDCNLGGLYTIELSTAAPPDLFYTTDGGEEYDEEDWDNSADEWESFEKTILCQTYREEFGGFDAYKEWQRRTNRGIQQDIGLFTGLEVPGFLPC